MERESADTTALLAAGIHDVDAFRAASPDVRAGMVAEAARTKSEADAFRSLMNGLRG